MLRLSRPVLCWCQVKKSKTQQPSCVPPSMGRFGSESSVASRCAGFRKVLASPRPVSHSSFCFCHLHLSQLRKGSCGLLDLSLAPCAAFAEVLSFGQLCSDRKKHPFSSTIKVSSPTFPCLPGDGSVQSERLSPGTLLPEAHGIASQPTPSLKRPLLLGEPLGVWEAGPFPSM